jgi:hypothetical protein
LKGEATEHLTAAIPQLKGNYSELRLWTVRRLLPAPPPAPQPAPAPSTFDFDGDSDFDLFDLWHCSPHDHEEVPVEEVANEVPAGEMMEEESGFVRSALESFSKFARKLQELMPKTKREVEVVVMIDAPPELDAMIEERGLKCWICDALGFSSAVERAEAGRINRRERAEKVPYV